MDRPKSAPENHSANATATDTDTQPAHEEATAMSRVMHNHDLVDLILHQVPPEYKRNLPRVSTAWGELVSKHRHVDPIPSSLGLDLRDQCAGVPHYTSDITFRINPALEQDGPDELEEDDTAFHDEHGVSVQLGPQLGEEEMKARGDEFISDPPITVISMNMLYSGMSATLRVKMGIRVRDFMAVYWAMVAQEPTIEHWSDGKEILPAGWFALCKDGKVFEPSPFKGLVVGDLDAS